MSENTPYYRHIAAKIADAKRDAARLAKDMMHPGIAGQLRELAAKECIKPFLTQSFQCGNGKIIDTFGQISDQIDLLIYQKKHAPPILFDAELGMFPIESVRYAFEVKSTVTAAEIRDSNKKFRSVTKLRGFPQDLGDGRISWRQPATTVLFGFSSDFSGSELGRYLKNTEGDKPPCSAICILGKGYWFFNDSNKSWYGNECTEDNKYIEFCMFIAGLMNSLAADEASLRGFSPGNYVTQDIGFLKQAHKY